MDPTITSAKTYVENFYPDWGTAFMKGTAPTAHAAYAYIRTPGANATDRQPNEDRYWRHGGRLLSTGAALPQFDARSAITTGAATSARLLGRLAAGGRAAWSDRLAQRGRVPGTRAGLATPFPRPEFPGDDLLEQHVGLRRRALIVISSFTAGSARSKTRNRSRGIRGLPPGVTEPDYPYFKGVDNYGVSDNNTSLYGPAPGFVAGRPEQRLRRPGESSSGRHLLRAVLPRLDRRLAPWLVENKALGGQRELHQLPGPYVALIAASCRPGRRRRIQSGRRAFGSDRHGHLVQSD